MTGSHLAGEDPEVLEWDVPRTAGKADLTPED